MNGISNKQLSEEDLKKGIFSICKLLSNKVQFLFIRIKNHERAGILITILFKK